MRGLALSGGGFRAALFHLGSLLRLNEAGLLKEMDEITSVSGGSIVAAYLGLKWDSLIFNDQGSATNFRTVIIDPIMTFCTRTIDVGTILGGVITPFRHPSQLLVSRYKKFLFAESDLQDLPVHGHGPNFTIYATSMQTGASVRFSREILGEYHLGEIKNPAVTLSQAVAASSAFPPPLCPVKLRFDPDQWNPTKLSNLFHDEILKSTMYLVDGGVYDNLGLERLTQCCSTIFVSDAGAPFPVKRKMYASRTSMIMRTKRTLNILSEQIRALRLRKLVADYKDGVFRGAYWGISTRIGGYPLEKTGPCSPLVHDNSRTVKQAAIRTRLNKFKTAEQAELINWGYALTDAGIRSYYDPEIPKAKEFPFPGFLQ